MENFQRKNYLRIDRVQAMHSNYANLKKYEEGKCIQMIQSSMTGPAEDSPTRESPDL